MLGVGVIWPQASASDLEIILLFEEAFAEWALASHRCNRAVHHFQAGFLEARERGSIVGLRTKVCPSQWFPMKSGSA